MGFIREPKGIDFVIDSGTLSDSDRAEISLYIKEYKLKAAERGSRKNNKLFEKGFIKKEKTGYKDSRKIYGNSE